MRVDGFVASDTLMLRQFRWEGEYLKLDFMCVVWLDREYPPYINWVGSEEIRDPHDLPESWTLV